jgi:hypothetical protein
MGVAEIVTNKPVNSVAAETNDLPHFQDVFRLLRANLPNVSDEDLNRAAVRGLLDQFYPRVMLASGGPDAAGQSESPLLAKTAVYEQAYGYLRVSGVATGLGDQIKSAYEKLETTNPLKGIVVDLRFAGGQDYTAAANAADRFLTNEQPLLDWDEGSAHSTEKTDAIRIPITVLVNQQTVGAAEALAAVLRETDAAVVIGSRTAGQAQVFKEFDLSNGQRLRIATGQVRVGKGKPLSSMGVTPDIEVVVQDNDEKAYFADEFKLVSGLMTRVKATNNMAQASSTNRSSRRRFNEAELVRLQREGSNPDEQEAAIVSPRSPEESPGPTVRDPALARALDLLKGIAVVKRAIQR